MGGGLQSQVDGDRMSCGSIDFGLYGKATLSVTGAASLVAVRRPWNFRSAKKPAPEARSVEISSALLTMAC